MNKKQRAAYALALLLGIVTVFGGVNCPILTGGFSEVLADSATSTIAASWDHKDSTVIRYVNGVKKVDGQIKKYDPNIYFYNKENNTRYYLEDSIVVEAENIKYNLHDFYYNNITGVFEGDASTDPDGDDNDDTAYLEFRPNQEIDSSTTNVSLTVTGYRYVNGEKQQFDFTNPVVNLVVVRDTTWNWVNDYTTVKEDQQINVTISKDAGSKFYYFVPNKTGKYYFNGTGGKDIAVWMYWFDYSDEYDELWKDLNEDEDMTFGFGSTNKKRSWNLVKGREYEIELGMVAYSQEEWQNLPDEETLSFIISTNDSSTGTPESSTVNSSSLYSGNNNRSSYISSSTSSRSSSSSSSSSSGYSTGDSRSAGSGSTSADYVKTGSDTVRYDATNVSNKATTAKVPATVKIGGKTYRVTTIAAGAFAGNTKLKSVTVGSNVKTIKSGAFKGCTNLKTLTLSTTKLTKKSVKGSLKGSSVKTINAPASKVDAYSKAFAKSNSGSKGKVNVKAKAKSKK